jgi:hypothetical protein
LGNDVILIVDDSKFIAQAYSRVLLGLVIEFLLPATAKLGFLLLKVVTRASSFSTCSCPIWMV